MLQVDLVTILTYTIYRQIIGISHGIEKGVVAATPFFVLFVAYFLSSHLQIRWQIVPAMTEVIIGIIISMAYHLLRLVGDGQRDNCIINISVCQYGKLTPRRASGGRRDF